jgi:hypothetical protein
MSGNISGRTDLQDQQKPVRKNRLLFYKLYKEDSWPLGAARYQYTNACESTNPILIALRFGRYL